MAWDAALCDKLQADAAGSFPWDIKADATAPRPETRLKQHMLLCKLYQVTPDSVGHAQTKILRGKLKSLPDFRGKDTCGMLFWYVFEIKVMIQTTSM